MSGIENISLFITTGILVNLYPGPDNLYIMGRSISQGRGAGIAAALGISFGALGHTLLAALGLSAILATSAQAFFIMKMLGCCYLLYQGISMLLKSGDMVEIEKSMGPLDRKIIFRQGAITNLLNPKVALFFLAFLPQFISPQADSKPLAFFILGGIFVTTGTLICLLVALFSSAVSEKLRNNATFSKWLTKANGALFTLLGLRLATLELE